LTTFSGKGGSASGGQTPKPLHHPQPSEAIDMETLEEAILRLEPRIDLLHHCLGFGRFAKVILTSDGHFFGQAWGESASTTTSEIPVPQSLR
jgi:hypothetical protein